MRNKIEVDNISDAIDFISLHIRNGYAVSAARVPYDQIFSVDGHGTPFKLDL